ncbi:zf-HC2 domain-containing protein [Saccharopolyspora mangrovi]|uniref:Zf-HC2 domain-containing protein n=1 Tax=Saccharopolyspora mangrovi TaxID=3082379 RepID=A0ABU6AKN5_9PSEU|nr:zf-HC2 domain-containing protein [Saccharopolyspora sp. S2-29]MEB3372063.1 zf-HC2 domain-containing protein [Saccharopolyspora sp. S2-29]
MKQPRDPFAHLDAAYVLGALSPEDRAAFEQHLTGCRSCAAAVGQVAGLPGLLAQVDPAQLNTGTEPADRLPQLLDEVRRSRRRRLAGTISAGVVALAACAAMVLSTQFTDAGPGTEMTALGAYPVAASVNLSDLPSGTRVDVDCEYEGRRAGDYVLVVVRRDGSTDELARWFAMPDNNAVLKVTTPVRRNEIRSLELRTPNGPALLTLPVTR